MARWVASTARALAAQKGPAASTGGAGGAGGGKSPPGAGAGQGQGARGQEDPEDGKSGLSLRQTLRRLDTTTRYQLAVLSAGTCVMSLGYGTIAPILPLFASQWGEMGATGVGLVLAAPALAKLLLNNYMGRRADTDGRVPMMVAGGGISAVGNVCTALVTSIPAVCGSRLLVGVGAAANGPASQAYLADVTSKFPLHRGAVMGTLGSIGMLSYGLGPAVGGLLAEAWGPGVCFGVVGAAAAVTAMAESTLPETLRRPHSRTAATGTGTATATTTAATTATGPSASKGGDGGDGGPESAALSTRQLLSKIPRLRGLLVMDTAVYIGWAVWLGVVPLHAVAVWDATPGTLGLMFSVMAVAGAVGAPLGGYLSDKLGRDAVIMAGAGCCALSTALLPWATSMLSFGAFLVVWDFGEGVAGAGLSALAAECAPDEHRGQVFALRSQVDSAVFLVAPVAVGVLADTYSLSASFAVSTATMAGALLAYQVLRPAGSGNVV